MKRFAQIAYPTAGVLLFFGIWALCCVVGDIDKETLPAPWLVLEAMVDKHPELLSQLWFTAQEILMGMVITLVIGIVLGIIIVDLPAVGSVLYPVLVSSQVIPKVVLGPIFLVWLGFGMPSKVAVAVTIAFFPVVLGTVLGLRSVSNDKRMLVRTMGAPWWKVLTKVRIPAALPYLMSGIKLAYIYCVSGAFIGEFVGADYGIGRTVLQASAGLDTATVFAATGYVILLALGPFILLSLLETATLRGRGVPGGK